MNELNKKEGEVREEMLANSLAHLEAKKWPFVQLTSWLAKFGKAGTKRVGRLPSPSTTFIYCCWWVVAILHAPGTAIVELVERMNRLSFSYLKNLNTPRTMQQGHYCLLNFFGLFFGGWNGSSSSVLVKKWFCKKLS
uniref:Uncharacterized protein n=1 Tax=Ditylenchus dipsaci TaxID=166011 RepID=A0A915D9Q9_9BILA